MYIRRTVKRTQAGKEYVHYLLVESVMTPKGPRQKTVCSLGNLQPRPRAQWEALVRKVLETLSGQKASSGRDPDAEEIAARVRRRQGRKDPAPAEELVSVRVQGVEVEEVREAGPIQVGRHFYGRLKIDTILRACGFSKRSRLLTEVMVLNRLVYPSSERAIVSWGQRTALADLLGSEAESLHESSLYRQLDRLHPQRGRIERGLSEQEKTLFNLEETLYLYDLTSTYFEGQARRNPAAQRGYSRDSRPDCKQVVIGLVLDGEGFPKAHEIFDGNRADSTTVEQMLEVLEQRLEKRKKPGGLVVLDRGMSGEENLKRIQAAGYDYLVACRPSERDQWLETFESKKEWKRVERPTSPTNPFQKKTVIQVQKVEGANESYLLCQSEARREKDRAIREKQEGRLLTDLGRLQRRIVQGRLKQTGKIHEAIGRLKERYPRVARYYEIEWDESSRVLSWQEHTDRKAQASTLDGCYLLKTSRRNLDDEEIWRIYILLTRVENAFRCMKSPLAERPIFHQLQHRTETHIFLCLLAYHLLISIEKTLLDQEVHTSWETVCETLSSHHTSTVVLPASNGDVLRIRKGSTPEPEVRRLYDLLRVPHTLMEPVKRWTRASADSDGK